MPPALCFYKGNRGISEEKNANKELSELVLGVVLVTMSDVMEGGRNREGRKEESGLLETLTHVSRHSAK